MWACKLAEGNGAVGKLLVAACMNVGFSPRLVHVVRHPLSMIQMIRDGLGVAVVPASYTDAASEGTAAFPLPQSDGRLQIDAVWRADHHPL